MPALIAAAPPEHSWHPKAPPLPKPTGPVIRVTTTEELFRAAESAQPNTTLLLAHGHYPLPRTLDLHADNLTLRSESADRHKVILDGSKSRHREGVSITNCSGVTIADLTIRNVQSNGVKINSDRFATRVTLHNLVLHNVWQRAVKGPAVRAEDRDRFRPSDCRIQYCLFYNDRPKTYDDDPSDTAENFGGNYVGGIDAMYPRRWIISDNVFVGIRGRTRSARGAVFLWQQAEDCVVERNVIVDCDSGVCLGNSHKPADVPVHATRCTVRNNFITRAPEQGILADYTKDCRILHNTIHDPDSRFKRLIRVVHDNEGLLIANNLLSGPPMRIETTSPIQLKSNLTAAMPDAFADAKAGNLRLRRPAPDIIDAAEPIPQLTTDIDNQPRDGKPDLGADEWSGPRP